jgi:dynein heavy chain
VDVVNNQAPEVERQRDSLIIEIGSSKNKLAKLQLKILNELAESDAGTILDNVVLIQTLEITREAGIKIAISLGRAQLVEKKINKTRNLYKDVSVRGSILYFSIVDMSGIDPMYQNSL